MRFLSLLLVLSAVGLVGCGSGEVAPEPDASETTSAMGPLLDQIIESGSLEDLGEELQTCVEEELMETDAAKAQALMPDVQELLSMTSPDEIKAKAAEIKGKL